MEARQLFMTFDEDNTLVENENPRIFYNWCFRNSRKDLLDEWDYAKNDGLDPKNITAGSDIKVWWIKSYDDPITGKHFDFSWKASVSKRVADRGCPYLSRPPQAIWPGFNDLATTNPELIASWDMKRNRDELGLTPQTVSKGNRTKVYWICPTHGSYMAPIVGRARGGGCPYCAGKQVKVGSNDLATMRPDIAKHWDSERNGVGPESVTIGSTKQVWWKCDLGHSWQTTPNDRTSAHVGCPYCSGRRVLQGFNDLATKNPPIAAEWDYERNGALMPEQVTSKSNRIVWWRCPAGHEYKAPVCNRTLQNQGCPQCNKERKTSAKEKAVFYYVGKAFTDAIENVNLPWLGKRELDIYIPSLNIGVEYDGSTWHKKPGVDEGKDKLCAKHGIHIIRIREEGCLRYDSSSTKIYFGPTEKIASLDQAIVEALMLLGCKDIDVDLDRDYSAILELYVSKPKINSLTAIRPDIAAEWDYEKNGKLNPDYVQVASNKTVWWKCPKCGVSYRMMVNARTGEKHSNCPYCAKKRILKGLNDFGTEHPELLPEWDEEKNELSPFQISSGSDKRVWWRCANGHVWEASIYSRVSLKTGCPYCAHQKTDGTNSFGILYPELLEEWDYEQNADDPFSLLPASNKRFHWICKKCGYHFVQTLSDRTYAHKGCTLCAHQVLVPGVNDLQTQYPEVAKEWNYERNELRPDQVSGGTNKKYWWKCKKCGYEWECVVASRTKRDSKCPRCSGKAIVPGVNDLASLCPDLMEEWDYEKNTIRPDSISIGSNKKAWWKCSKGHSWEAVVHTRTLTHCGCPYCANKRVIPGENDLETLFPAVAAEWNYDKNALKPSEVLPGSNKKFWFKCQKCNYEWDTVLASRTRLGTGCPVCAGKKPRH